MKSLKNLAIGAVLLASASVVSFAAMAKDLTVGVSWSNFQEERWKTDEAAIKKALAAHGAKYISADAQASPTKQLTDVEDLISKGANVLIILAMDSEAILPAVKKASDEGIPVIAYDRLIESPNVLYITFDNVGVGRMMAKAIYAVKPAGNYAFIKGDKGDPNADFLFSGIKEVLEPAIKAGKIKNVGESYTDGWKPDNAQKNMEQILTKNNNKVDAVVCRERRHGRRRRRGALRPGHGGLGSGVGTGRRPCGDQPHRAWHPDRLDLEGRPRPRQDRRRSGRRTWRRQEDDRHPRREAFHRRRQGGQGQWHPSHAAPDHQGQPQRDRGQGLDHQGGGLRRREAQHDAFCD